MTEIAYRETTTAIAFAGSADSGKSTTIAAVIYNRLDDGLGTLRNLVAKHQHEIKRGKTSDISTKILDIPDKNKALTIIDLCGQPDYFGTTTFGLSGYFPDYAVLIVAANNGVLEMTKQHMRVLASLSIPILVIITRVDLVADKPEVYKETMAGIRKLITSMCGKMAKIEFMNDPFNNETTTDEYKTDVKNKIISKITEDNGMNKQVTFPVITISNKSGYYLDVLMDVMKELPIRDLWVTVNEKYIAENKVIKFFKQNITQRIFDNFIHKFISSTNKYSELDNIIKDVMDIKKEFEKQKEEKEKNSSLLGIVSNFVFSSLIGQSKEQRVQTMITEYCSKNNIVLVENQNKIIYDFVLSNSTVTSKDIKNYLINNIMQTIVKTDDMSNNMMTSTYRFILKNIVEKNELEKLVDGFYDLCINDKFGDDVKKMDVKQISCHPNIANIVQKSSCITDIMRNADMALDKFIFQEYQNIDGSIFYIDNCYNPPGIGLVITGINRGGDISINDDMLIGPVGKELVKFKVKSMHNNNRENLDKLRDHNRGTIAISLTKKGEIRRNQIRKGMIAMSSIKMNKYVCYKFKAAVTVFSKSLTIRTGYTPVVHIGTIRQPARIILDPEENDGQDNIGFNAKSTNFAIVTFKFKVNPEFVEPYSVFLFRSGDIHGLGVVLSTTPIYEDPDAKPDEQKVKHQRRGGK
jgi:GTPase